MQNLGYGDRDVVESEYDENPVNSATYAAYERLRDDPVFLQRLLSAPSYQQPRSDSDTRSAYPIEFLYQMVAGDRGDAALARRCRRTRHSSCRSRAGAPSVTMLFEPCLHHGAKFCDPLPRAGSSRFINEVYDSYERCRESGPPSRSTAKSNTRAETHFRTPPTSRRHFKRSDTRRTSPRRWFPGRP
jgi:hypothetical protein